MRALLTEQGTAASETALCLDCFEVPEHVQWARDRADSDVDPDGFFVLTDRPEVYNLPAAPTLPSRRVAPGLLRGLATMAGVALAAAALFAGGARRG